MSEIQDMLEALDSLYPKLNHDAWRIIAALTEEAGEVQGAFNKMMDGRKDKPKGWSDILQELVQLTGCCFIAAYYMGVQPAYLLPRISDFYRAKAAQLAALKEENVMISDEIDKRFTYHPPKGDQGIRYEMIRDWARELAHAVDEKCPDSREKSLALTSLEECVFWANAAIARRE